MVRTYWLQQSDKLALTQPGHIIVSVVDGHIPDDAPLTLGTEITRREAIRLAQRCVNKGELGGYIFHLGVLTVHPEAFLHNVRARK